MTPAVRAVYGIDVDIDSYYSEDPLDDGVWVRLIIGPLGEAGEESFDVLVCTPRWLEHRIAEAGPQIGRHHLLVNPMNLNDACSFLKERISRLRGRDWADLADQLSRIGYWEFEDYRP